MPTPSRSFGTIALVIACLVPFAASLAVTLFWYTSDRQQIAGDEPHYLYIADSVFRDRDFDLRNNYQEDAATGRIAGRVYRHISGPRGFSGHAVGLGILLAVPFGLGGVLGVKLLLCAQALAAPFLIFSWLRPTLGLWRAMLLSITLSLGLPLSVAANQIFPDTLAGVLALVLMTQIIRWARSGIASDRAAIAFSIMNGILPWLHIRYVPATLLFAAGALWLAAPDAGRRARVRQAALLSAAPALLLAALALYHAVGFGSVVGPRALAELFPNTRPHARVTSLLGPLAIGHLTLDPARALMYFLGLHLDQAQGMFVQQPLLLLGLPGLCVMMRRSGRIALLWGLVYLSLTIPGAMALSYGGWAPAGRLGWSAVWLWVVPLGYCLAELGPGWLAFLPTVCGVSAVYQLWLARLWLNTPLILYPVMQRSLWARNSLFEGALRGSLPSFYNFETFLAYLPNWIFVLGCVLLAISGGTLAGIVRPDRVRRLWIGFAVLCAIVYPTGAPAWDVPQNVAQREAEMMDAVESLVPRRFEAEQMPSPLSRESVAGDAEASGGHVRTSSATTDSDLMIFGPYVNLPAGSYRIDWALTLDAGPAAPAVGMLDVASGGGRDVHARRWLSQTDFARIGYTRIGVEFATRAPLADVEFRLFVQKGVVLRADYVELTPLVVELRRGWFHRP